MAAPPPSPTPPYESESSPDPLGQPDLSSPSFLRSPQSSRSRSRSARKSRPGKSKLSLEDTTVEAPSHNRVTTRSPLPRLPTPPLQTELSTPSPEPVGFESTVRSPSSGERRLLSPWRPQASTRVSLGREEVVEELSREGDDEMDERSAHMGMDGQIDDVPSRDTITTTVPLKTGEETPKRRKKRRALTPKRRKKSTPASRKTQDTGVEGLNEAETEHDEDAENVRSPTPKRSPGRPRKALANGTPAEDPKIAVNPVVAAPMFRFQRPLPHDTDAVLGASPGKRRRVVSNGDSGDSVPLFADMPKSSNPRSQTSITSPRRSPRQAMKNAMQPATAQPTQDPTDEHEEFDSILESEDFTMVSLSSIPSGQQLRSLTRGGPQQPESSRPVRSSPRRSSLRRQIENVATPRQPATVAAAVADAVAPATSTREPNTPYGGGLLAGFSPATRRELRAGLRLGQELARRSVQAKKAAAAVGLTPAAGNSSLLYPPGEPETELEEPRKDQTEPGVDDPAVDVFADLAELESSGFSNSNVDSQVNRPRAAASRLSTRSQTPPRIHKNQLPSPDQSDEQEANNDAGNEMSWRYDTPAKSKLGLSATRRQASPGQPEMQPDAESDQDDEGPDLTAFHSSPDKQLFLEQAAAELEASRAEISRIQSKISDPVELSSESSSASAEESSEDEEPPEMSDATKSLLADATLDIWQTEAETEASMSRYAHSERAFTAMTTPTPEPSEQSVNATNRVSTPPRQIRRSATEDSMSATRENALLPADQAQDTSVEITGSNEATQTEEVEIKREEPTTPTSTTPNRAQSPQGITDIAAGDAAEDSYSESEGEESRDPLTGSSEHDLDIEDDPVADEVLLRERRQRSAEVPPSPFISTLAGSQAESLSSEEEEDDESEDEIAPEDDDEDPSDVEMVDVGSPAVKQQPVQPQSALPERDLIPPRRGKILSAWRRQSDEPVVYSDEVDLPPAEDLATLRASGRRQKTFVTPENRKKTRYNDADFSVMSEFKGTKRKATTQLEPPADQEMESSPLKRVRFESEDPDNPYYPTTPINQAFSPAEETIEEADENEASLSSQHSSPRDRNTKDKRSPPNRERITWDSKPKSALKAAKPQGRWLTGLLPSWFKRPIGEPMFRFSLPNLPQIRVWPSSTSSATASSATGPQSESQTRSKPNLTLEGLKFNAYVGRKPPPEFGNAHYDELKRLYQKAKKRPFPEPSAEDVTSLLGREISRLGWRKRVNHWELGIIAEFLRLDNPLAENVTPEQVARRLFSIWAVEVQKGVTGLGNGTAGMFSTQYIANRSKNLKKAAKLRSLAAE